MKVRILPLDRLFSEFIRKRAMQRIHGCERCLTGKISYKQLQCSHFWGRSKKSTRWDPDDATGLCPACHMFFGQHPAEHTKWFKKRLGKRDYDLLDIRAHTPQKPDINAITIYLREKIKELEDGNSD